MSGSYPIPASSVSIENRITKSLFIAYLFHTANPESFSHTLDLVRKEHKGASHNCWAYITGAPDDSTKRGMSDDGEPKGCAGKPMLHVLSHSGIGEIGAIVTRYYGGVKLGTGGLTRAYSKSVQLALQDIKTKIKTQLVHFSVILPYPLQPAVEQIIGRHQAEITEARYESVITLEVAVAKECSQTFQQQLQQMNYLELIITVKGEENGQALS